MLQSRFLFFGVAVVVTLKPRTAPLSEHPSAQLARMSAVTWARCAAGVASVRGGRGRRAAPLGCHSARRVTSANTWWRSDGGGDDSLEASYVRSQVVTGCLHSRSPADTLRLTHRREHRHRRGLAATGDSMRTAREDGVSEFTTGKMEF